MRSTLHFEPSARLQSILSRELVADPNVAVLEFVKNAYDAGAEQVLVELQLRTGAERQRLIVADDGHGMDLESFKRNWMRPGYSEKANEDFRARAARVPAGEKGLGRLAAGRLGDVLDVYTRERRKDPWLHARFVWADFDDMDRDLRKVNIAIDDETEPDVTVADVGTVVEISGLRLNWNAKVPGRKAAGRHPTRIGRLRQDLELLLLPLSAASDEFRIWLDHDSTQEEDEPPGKVEAPYVELIHYRYDFELVRLAKGWQVRRTIHRGPELLTEFPDAGLRKRETVRARIEPTEGGAPLDETGPLQGTFFYAPDRAEQLRRLHAPVGVPLYRDGIRVEPYGRPGNDWLGVQARKASRQGYAPIQPAALYGAVRITRKDNPRLRSQANREGLIENDSYETFLSVCRGEFAVFEKIVFDEYLEPNWRSVEQQRQDRAKGRQTYALALTRSMMHAVSQPVATANAHLDRLQTIIQRRVDDERLREELQGLHDRTASQVSRIGEAIRRVLEVVDFDPTPERFDVGDLIVELLHEREGNKADEDVDISLDLDDNLSVELPRVPVRVAIEELLDNAGQSPRPDDGGKAVHISTATARGRHGKPQIVVAVEDNGTGIARELRGDLFRRAESTTGGIGMGLILIRQLLELIGASIALDDKATDGARFTITLPALTT